ncbi:serine O-acetyltransferase [Paenibacillus sp. FSL L8-0463]|uniref:serine O-acetyltransferase n=1 Tax=Paenibacillus sp. FSL L8-0463 TaxID=2954687 RepID=UPI003119AC26
MFRYIFQDFKARKMSYKEILIRLFFDRGISAIFIFRLSSWCWNHKLKVIAAILKQINIFINKCDIACQAEIGTGIRIFHALGIVISDCKIGVNFTIYQNVTVGLNGRVNDSGQSSPIIDDNVTFYTGCVIAGPIFIGENVRVGANAVVLKDIPSFSTVIGAKSEILLPLNSI